MINFVSAVGNDYYPDPKETLFTSIFSRYEYVIIESIITSFGLDFIISDQHGGDVDTVHNVQEIGIDSKMTYKNKANEEKYNSRGEYSYCHTKRNGELCKNKNNDYHDLNSNYRKTKHETRKYANEYNNGIIKDEYTGKDITFSRYAPADKKASLDHAYAAKTIHDDRAVSLSGIKGCDLANSPENLVWTNSSLNSSMQDKDIPEYINSHPEISERTKENMMTKYNYAKYSIDKRINYCYYTSQAFVKDTALAAGKLGAKMGLRQAFGFLFANIWFSIKEEFEKAELSWGMDLNLGDFFKAIANGIKRGVEKTGAMETVCKLIEGSVTGALSSLTTTLCNVFFTTAKNAVKIIRESYVSIVEACKVLFINPDNYLFGDRIIAAARILATGASVVVGSLVGAAIGATPIGHLPLIGDIIQTFCGSFVTGVMSCTLLLFIDRSSLARKLTGFMKNVHLLGEQLHYYKEQAEYFEQYAAELMKIDINTFHREASVYLKTVSDITNAKNENELNLIMVSVSKTLGIKNSWDDSDSFDSFMNDKNSVMVFK